MITLETILSERTFDTYFVQVVIRMKKDFNFTEIYNQIRGIKDVVVVKIVDHDKLDRMSAEGDYKYALVNIKYISEGTAIDTITNIKREALKIPGLYKFLVRTNTLLKIRNY